MLFRTLTVTALLASAGFAADHMMGTWKMNPAKSKYTGAPAPKEYSMTFTPEGTGWRYVGKGVAADGKPINMSFVYVKDGEEIKITGFAYADAMTIKDGHADTGTSVMMQGGKQVGTLKRSISKDGKVLTISANYAYPDGKKMSYTSIYEKQ